MLTNATIRQINHQIQDELRIVARPSFMTSDEEKSAALDRVAKLRNILEPEKAETPSRKAILQELADALVNAIIQVAHRENLYS
jgi:hypothetical protein